MGPSLIFQARCPACARDANFIEFRMESCLVEGEGPPKGWRGFRCTLCGHRAKEVTGADGLHRWQADKHEVAPVDAP